MPITNYALHVQTLGSLHFVLLLLRCKPIYAGLGNLFHVPLCNGQGVVFVPALGM